MVFFFAQVYKYHHHLEKADSTAAEGSLAHDEENEKKEEKETESKQNGGMEAGETTETQREKEKQTEQGVQGTANGEGDRELAQIVESKQPKETSNVARQEE